MAKYDPSAAPKKKSDYAYPSRFGSHKGMVVAENGDKVTCKDEFGEYETEAWRLDDNSADPNRFTLTSRNQNYV